MARFLSTPVEWLEERGAKGLILMRFANATEQGLILENGPDPQGADGPIGGIVPGHDD